jgi:hypothetical protein
VGKPTWKAESQTPLFVTDDGCVSPRKRPICANCGWRLSRTIGEPPNVSALPWCEVCEAEHGGQRQPAPRRLPELPTKKRTVDTIAVKDRLAAIGAIPITCKRCGAGDHTSESYPAAMAGDALGTGRGDRGAHEGER